jgi:plasmid stability protein
MNNEQKAQMYNQLLSEHTRTMNEISSIKGESIDLNNQQLMRIRQLEDRQRQIMSSIQRMMS